MFPYSCGERYDCAIRRPFPTGSAKQRNFINDLMINVYNNLLKKKKRTDISCLNRRAHRVMTETCRRAGIR